MKARNHSRVASALPHSALTGFTSTLSDGAAAWMTPNRPIPVGVAVSRRTAARVTLGAICSEAANCIALDQSAPIMGRSPKRI